MGFNPCTTIHGLDQIGIMLLDRRRVWQMLRSTFMPAGYPKTVGPLYLKFSFWSSVTNVAVSANSGQRTAMLCLLPKSSSHNGR